MQIDVIIIVNQKAKFQNSSTTTVLINASPSTNSLHQGSVEYAPPLIQTLSHCSTGVSIQS